MKRRDVLGSLATAFFLLSSYGVSADAPKLLLQGDIATEGPLTFTLESLAEFEQQTFDTSTNWTKGTHAFSGPTLWQVLQEHGAGEGDLELEAANNYRVTVDRALVTEDAPIIATHIDGETFGPRNKGPFWVIFPYDSSPDYQSEVVFAASVWQLNSITVLKD